MEELSPTGSELGKEVGHFVLFFQSYFILPKFLFTLEFEGRERQWNVDREVADKTISNLSMDTKGGKPRWGGDGGVLNWAIGIDMYTLMCIKLMTNKNLQYKKTNKQKNN